MKAVILMRAQRAEDLLSCHAVCTGKTEEQPCAQPALILNVAKGRARDDMLTSSPRRPDPRAPARRGEQGRRVDHVFEHVPEDDRVERLGSVGRHGRCSS